MADGALHGTRPFRARAGGRRDDRRTGGPAELSGRRATAYPSQGAGPAQEAYCVLAVPALAARRRGQMARRQDGGSAWVLAPAAVLILVVLAAMSVDSAATFLGQRQLADAAATAATDAASAALSESSFYSSGTIAIDPRIARQVATSAARGADLSGVVLTGVYVTVTAATVCVRLTGAVHAIFGRALPGIAHLHPVQASAVASTRGVGVATAPGLCAR